MTGERLAPCIADSSLAAVWFDPDTQTLRFVPGVVSLGADGREEMTIRISHDSLSAWARTAVARSVAAGILGGYLDGTIAPQEEATRAQAVTMLLAFLRYIGFISSP